LGKAVVAQEERQVDMAVVVEAEAQVVQPRQIQMEVMVETMEVVKEITLLV
jgi:hypothetical protein